MVLEPWKYILAGLVATLGSFDHFQLPSWKGNNKCQSLKAKRKPSWHWIVPIVIILSPPHSKMNFVHVFVTNNKRYSIDMNVAQYHLVHLNCGIWKLCLWNSKSRRNYIICCTVEKRRLYSWSPIIFLDFHLKVIWVTQAIAIGLVCCQVSSVNNFTI